MNAPTNNVTDRAIPKVITSTAMRQHWLKGNVRQVTPLTDVIVKFAGHWWNLDGDDAWVRVTDPNLIAIYERQHERWKAADQELQRKIKR
jgi:hypothetical protein